MKAHNIYDDDDWVESTNSLGRPLLAHVYPASRQSVDYVLSQDVDDLDGRSEWLWLRLANGDLMLGVFPQGDTYCSVEVDGEVPIELIGGGD